MSSRPSRDRGFGSRLWASQPSFAEAASQRTHASGDGSHSRRLDALPPSLSGAPTEKPTRDEKPFDRAEHDELQRFLTTFGDPELLEPKRRVFDSVTRGDRPQSLIPPQGRFARGAWIPERSATRLREADLNVLSKLGNQGLEGRLEPEAFTGGEV